MLYHGWLTNLINSSAKASCCVRLELQAKLPTLLSKIRSTHLWRSSWPSSRRPMMRRKNNYSWSSHQHSGSSTEISTYLIPSAALAWGKKGGGLQAHWQLVLLRLADIDVLPRMGCKSSYGLTRACRARTQRPVIENCFRNPCRPPAP